MPGVGLAAFGFGYAGVMSVRVVVPLAVMTSPPVACSGHPIDHTVSEIGG